MTTPMTPSTNKPTAKPDQAGAPEHQARMRPDRAVQAQALADVQALLQGLPLRRDLLIEHLHRINDAHGHLRTDHLAALAQLLRLSQAQVFEVATFYHHFEVVRENSSGGFDAPPTVRVRVCNGLTCEMAGSLDLLNKLPALLGTQVQVLAAPCIGRCEQAPAAVVHQYPLAQASLQSVVAAVQAGQRVAPAAQGLSMADYCAQGGYALLKQCWAGTHTVDSIITGLDDSGLRGLGGAGFAAARKWRIVREQPAPRLMAVNIDEGEPGTFKDRHYLERDPHRFLEGMLIAAWAVQAQAVYIYLRDEYHGGRALLQEALDTLRAAPDMSQLPQIELRRGAGAYICGEESAMLESIEGKRGLPRLRPPYVAQVGLFGRPTLVHNFETLYWVRQIIERGGAWSAAQGRHGRKGLRSFSVSGRINKPGVHLAPAGITLQELIDEFCGGMLAGHALYAYLPGGASGGILPAALAHMPLDFDTLQPHGAFIGSAAIVVLSQHDRASQAARNLMAFFEHESCGQCTPCRSGTAKVRELIQSQNWNTPLLADLSQVMRDASICGLGQAAPNPVDSVIKFFSHELRS